MKKVLRYILPIAGLLSVLIFCVSATADISEGTPLVGQTLSEPINMLLIGVGLIGFASFIRKNTAR